MRRDMAKLVCERPRRHADGGIGTRIHRRHLNRIDGETDVKRESMRRHHQRDHRGKTFDDHLAPLRRFLRSSVGRPWDDVYAEICTVLKKTSTIQRHVFQHLKCEVELHVVMVDGVPHHRWGHRWMVPLPDGALYVSDQGILRRHGARAAPP